MRPRAWVAWPRLPSSTVGTGPRRCALACLVAACEDALHQGADQTRASSYEAYAAVHCASIVEMVLMTSTYEFFVKMMLVAAAGREPAPAPEPEAQRDDGDDDEGGAE